MPNYEVEMSYHSVIVVIDADDRQDAVALARQRFYQSWDAESVDVAEITDLDDALARADAVSRP